MKKIRTLYNNKWLSLKEITDPENGIIDYVYSHETRSDGKIVAILPYRVNNNGKTEYLLRSETTPSWSLEEQISSITGGVEGNDHLTTAQHELKEEGGYSVDKDELKFLGTCFGSKSSDTIYYLYTVNLTDKKQGKATGDGSVMESKAHCFWSDTIKDAVDPLVYVLFNKLDINNIDPNSISVNINKEAAFLRNLSSSLKQTIIVRTKKINKNDVLIENKQEHENSTFEISGNYLIITEHGKITARIPYELNKIISWGTRK